MSGHGSGTGCSSILHHLLQTCVIRSKLQEQEQANQSNVLLMQRLKSHPSAQLSATHVQGGTIRDC